MHRTVTLDTRPYECSGDTSFINTLLMIITPEPLQGYKWVCKDAGGRRFNIYSSSLEHILKYEIIQGNLWQIASNGKCKLLMRVDRRVLNKPYLNYNKEETVKCI